MQEVIPGNLLQRAKADDFLLWLRVLSIPREDKKQLLIFWADRVGIKVTGEMLTRAGLK